MRPIERAATITAQGHSAIEALHSERSTFSAALADTTLRRLHNAMKLFVAAPGRGAPLVLVPTAEGVKRIRGAPSAVALRHLLTLARPAGAPQPAWPAHVRPSSVAASQ